MWLKVSGLIHLGVKVSTLGDTAETRDGYIMIVFSLGNDIVSGFVNANREQVQSSTVRTL